MGKSLNLARENRRIFCNHTSRCLRRNKPCENHKFLTNRTISSARRRTSTASFQKKHPNNSNHQQFTNLAQTRPRCPCGRTRPPPVISQIPCPAARCSRWAIGARARSGPHTFPSAAVATSHSSRRASTRGAVVRGAAPPVTYVRVRLEAASINKISHCQMRHC